ncbi:STAS domain-containing protein [Streptomyces xanthochromogenes]|uniref:STAS domain-containing protein n=1 Tax=Streptomyces TaxID=1883 RepID=UPI001369D3C5|nr:STAS domain-containing protein [Streptomyces sp. SID1034]MYV93468.1 anti-sigma factor antagonist [Streptomyces sp. SID1034]
MPAPWVETIASGLCLVARVSGDLDYLTVPVLRPQFTELFAQTGRSVVLDLSVVGFCDSVGLELLLEAWRQADGSGGTLFLVCVPPALQQIFQVTGVDQLLRAYDSVATAKAALRA